MYVFNARFYTALAVGALAFCAVFFFSSEKKELLREKSSGGSARVTELRSLIRTEGASRAAKIFSDSIQRVSINTQHEEAHLFGRALYYEVGLDGFTACDSQFSFGCFHEFIGLAIAEKGPQVIAQLNEGCISQGSGNLGCQHGIGHGVVAFTGYSEKDLQEATRLCKTLRKGDPIGGCFGGMYMEYNLHTMQGSGGGSRPYTYENRFAPCAEAQEHDMRRACLYWQTQWWEQLLSTPGNIENFVTMGNFCREARDRFEVYQECFEGIGNVTSSASGFSVKKAQSLCKKAARTPTELLWCTSVAANHFGVQFSTSEGESMCSIIENAEDKTTCMKWAQNRLNIVDRP